MPLRAMPSTATVASPSFAYTPAWRSPVVVAWLVNSVNGPKNSALVFEWRLACSPKNLCASATFPLVTEHCGHGGNPDGLASKVKSALIGSS